VSWNVFSNNERLIATAARLSPSGTAWLAARYLEVPEDLTVVSALMSEMANEADRRLTHMWDPSTTNSSCNSYRISLPGSYQRKLQGLARNVLRAEWNHGRKKNDLHARNEIRTPDSHRESRL
jgi:hypothetical protein